MSAVIAAIPRAAVTPRSIDEWAKVIADDLIHAPRREHSRKPDEAYELIERMYPELPRIELFARARRPGWDAWGNETEKFAATESAADCDMSAECDG